MHHAYGRALVGIPITSQPRRRLQSEGDKSRVCGWEGEEGKSGRRKKGHSASRVQVLTTHLPA